MLVPIRGLSFVVEQFGLVRRGPRSRQAQAGLACGGLKSEPFGARGPVGGDPLKQAEAGDLDRLADTNLHRMLPDDPSAVGATLESQSALRLNASPTTSAFGVISSASHRR